MNLDDALTRFPDAKRHGAGWSAKCPAHDDRHASLSIGTGDDGRTLLHCHGGCSLDAILGAVSLETRDLFPDKPQTKAIVATYSYRDEAGGHLFDVVRFAPKDFRQRRADGAWTMAGVRRVLLGLPELHAQPEVYVVEGERDVLALRAIGLPATTNPGGAGKWRPDYADQLIMAGATHVVVLPDHDAPGLKHAREVAMSCQAVGLTATIVELPGLAAKGDVSDWLAAGHTKAELIALVKATGLFAPAPPVGAPAAAAAGPVVVTLADVQPETVSYLWPNRIARRKLNLIVGDPGLGKSQLTLDVAARVSRGAAWPEGSRAPLGDVILLSAEDGLADTIRPRLDVLGADVTRVHALRAIRNTKGDERGFCLASDVAQLERVIEQTGAVLVIIDPISAYLGATDSYKDGEVRGVLAPLAALAERAGPAFLGVMHLGKGAQRPALYRALGSVAFVAAARIVLAVAPHPDDDTRRVLAPVKANICAPSAVLSFTLGAGRLEWDAAPVSGLDIDALLSTGTDRHERRAADDWLREVLADGPVAVREIRQAATSAGLTWHTVERAKDRLRIAPYKLGYGAEGRWFWRWPNTADGCLKTATYDQVAVLSETPTRTGDFTDASLKTATQPELAVLRPATEDDGNERF